MVCNYSKTPKVLSLLLLTTFIWSCSNIESNNVNTSYTNENQIDDVKGNILSNCVGTTSLDIWAGFGGVGPEFVFNSGKKNASSAYFRGDIKEAKNFKTTKKNIDTVDYMQRYLGNDLKLLRFYQETIPISYLDMCENKNHVNAIVNSFITENINIFVEKEKRWSNQLYISSNLLNWELRAHQYTQNNDEKHLKNLLQEVDSFTQSDDIFLRVLNNPSDFSPLALSNVNIIRVALLKARIRSIYAIKANSPLDMGLAYDTFFKIQAITQSDQSLRLGLNRGPIFALTHKSALSSYRFTAALNELFIMQSITSEITHYPEWLQSPNEALKIYADRISKRSNSYSNDLCPLPTQNEMKALIAEKKALLFCQTPVNLFRNTLQNRIGKYERSEIIFDSVLRYEDSQLIWAKNQFQKYRFYKRLENIYNEDKPQSLKNTSEWSLVRNCKAKKALEHARSVMGSISSDLNLESACT